LGTRKPPALLLASIGAMRGLLENVVHLTGQRTSESSPVEKSIEMEMMCTCTAALVFCKIRDDDTCLFDQKLNSAQ
jgi:hypothetical protein